MLSKSQARTFFLVGTLLFSVLFLFLTVDTVRQVPAQTRAKNITPAVARGKHLWDQNNCMGCHALLGEGAYYAPELTKVYERRGAAWMDVFLKDPQAMFPGQRKMVKYKFSDQDRQDLIAFFKWIGEMDLNGFPPRPSRELNAGLPAQVTPPASPSTRTDVPAPRPTTQPSSQAATRVGAAPQVAAAPAMPVKFQQLCVACHMLGGKGGRVGPALDGVGKKYNVTSLRKWLEDPQGVKPGTAMPKLPFTAQELDQMVAFLLAQK